MDYTTELDAEDHDLDCDFDALPQASHALPDTVEALEAAEAELAQLRKDLEGILGGGGGTTRTT